MTAALLAGAGAVALRAQHSPYAGNRERDIKALSAEQTAQLLAGDGMGFAMAAELNGYPGPKHLLELADALGLTADQVARIEVESERMRREAAELGEAYVAAERQLDRLFAGATVDVENLKHQVIQSGRLRAGIRFAHLRAHLATVEILTPEQVEAYGRLRGYHEPGREHDPTSHEGHSHGS